jgi:hypothetical protein
VSDYKVDDRGSIPAEAKEFYCSLCVETSSEAHPLSYPMDKKQSSPATRHGGAWGERRYSSYSFLTSALDGVSGQRHAPAALYPRIKDPGTHWTGGWVGLRAGLDRG